MASGILSPSLTPSLTCSAIFIYTATISALNFGGSSLEDEKERDTRERLVSLEAALRRERESDRERSSIFSQVKREREREKIIKKLDTEIRTQIKTANHNDFIDAISVLAIMLSFNRDEARKSRT